MCWICSGCGKCARGANGMSDAFGLAGAGRRCPQCGELIAPSQKECPTCGCSISVPARSGSTATGLAES